MISAWLQKRRVKRMQREIEIEKLREQAVCLHDWRYIGEESVEYYNGIDSDWYTRHKLYCPHCDAEETHNTKAGAEQAIVKAELRREIRK